MSSQVAFFFLFKNLVNLFFLFSTSERGVPYICRQRNSTPREITQEKSAESELTFINFDVTVANMAGPDFVDTLSSEDARQVVYAARDKPYMKSYLRLLEVMHARGKFKPEPTIEYIANEVADNLLVYGVVSERMRNNRSGRDMIFHTHIEDDETGHLEDVTFEFDDTYELILILYDGKRVGGTIPRRLIDDLREFESKKREGLH